MVDLSGGDGATQILQSEAPKAHRSDFTQTSTPVASNDPVTGGSRHCPAAARVQATHVCPHQLGGCDGETAGKKQWHLLKDMTDTELTTPSLIVVDAAPPGPGPTSVSCEEASGASPQQSGVPSCLPYRLSGPPVLYSPFVRHRWSRFEWQGGFRKDKVHTVPRYSVRDRRFDGGKSLADMYIGTSGTYSTTSGTY